MSGTVKMTREEWFTKGSQLFGSDVMTWQFRCPACGHVQSPEAFRQYATKGATPESALQECLGRYLPKEMRGGWSRDHSNPDVKQPCDYAAFGFFRLAPVTVVIEDGSEQSVFGFNEAP